MRIKCMLFLIFTIGILLFKKVISYFAWNICGPSAFYQCARLRNMGINSRTEKQN